MKALSEAFNLDDFRIDEQELFAILPNNKTCPNCGLLHTKRGPFCSRSCGNVRTYTSEQKAQKSRSHKNPTIHVSQKQLKELFTYDAANGGLIHKTERPVSNNFAHLRDNGQSRVGQPAARINERKNRTVKHIDINNKSYLEHRLVYYWHTGEYPRLIDHINGNPLDNRIENLRPCEYWQNAANTRLRTTRKKTLPRGVIKQGNKYYAQILVNGVNYNLGLHDTAEDAYNAYCAKHYELRGEFAIKLPPFSSFCQS